MQNAVRQNARIRSQISALLYTYKNEYEPIWLIENPESIKWQTLLTVCVLSFCLSVPVFSGFLCQYVSKLSVSCILHHCLHSCLFVFLLSLCFRPLLRLSSCLSIFSCLCFPFCLSVDLFAYLSSSIFYQPTCLSILFLSLCLPFCRSIFLLPKTIPTRFLSPFLFVYLSSSISLLLPFSLSSFRSVYLPPVSIFLPISLSPIFSVELPTLLSFLSLCLSLTVCLFPNSPSLSIYLYPSSWLFLVSFLSLFLPCLYFCVWGQNVTPLSLSNPSKTT